MQDMFFSQPPYKILCFPRWLAGLGFINTEQYVNAIDFMFKSPYNFSTHVLVHIDI